MILPACTGGPYKCGTTGTCSGCCCNCNCGCCVPCPCYKTLKWKFRCGSRIEDFPVEGCLCPSFTFMEDKDFPEFPDFNLDNSAFNFELPDQNFVQALQACSIPCEEYYIIVDFTGCCLKLLSHSQSLNACFCVVGDGFISANVVTACEDTFDVLLIGEDVTVNIAGITYQVYDGDNYCIQIIPPTAQPCCDCCEIGNQPGGFAYGPFETVLAAECESVVAFSMTKKNKITGAKKTFINKNELIKRINKRR